MDHEFEGGAHDVLRANSSLSEVRGVHFDSELATPESDDMTQPTAVYRSMFSHRSHSFGTPSSSRKESSSFGYDDVTMGIGVGTPQSSPRSLRDVSRVSVQEIARDMVLNRKLIDEGVGLTHPDDVRDSIRMIQAHSRRELPQDCDLKSTARIKNKSYTLTLSRDTLAWFQESKRVGFIDTDDIVGAEALSGGATSACFRVHYFRKGKGSKPSKALLRTHHVLVIDTSSECVASAWIRSIQELVRWQARAPPTSWKRRIRVVVNPHSGRRNAPRIWEHDVKPFFDLAGFDYHVDHTTYGGHAVDMGRDYSTDEGYEAIVFVSGDGTICEYMNGLLARPEEEWRHRKLRPLDVCTAMAADDHSTVQYSCCGLGWGVPGDIAAESEKYRWMGTKRYAFLKVKRALFPKRHTGRLQYVPLKPQPPLRPYDEIKNLGADDQYEVEEGNIYDGMASVRNASLRAVTKLAGAGKRCRPASARRFREEWWTTETGSYVAVGVLNSAPDGAYCHPSDGCLDLLVARKGNLFQMLHLAVLYLLGKEEKSSLMSYVKVKAVVISQNESDGVMNMDGEVLPGPGPWRMEVVPSLFKVLSEK
ncbi:hypothetical protein DYB32_000140 [Aphanomyces invadans]|uniref:DAGKc domain-containing protein n=1 Tax=Aphanomyces invadans TaxID=157072 RepID=A0A3R6Z6E4_9STRA|nr:hypothetical protein DYB32_000140 [Aphanomyces invadans]